MQALKTSAASRQHRAIPDEVTGYPFDPFYSWWAAIVAEESTNLIINPSFERMDDLGLLEEYDASGTFDELGPESIVQTYAAVGATAGRRMAALVGASGTGTFDYNAGLAVTPGEYTFSLDLYVETVPATVRLQVLRTTEGPPIVVGETSIRIERRGWQRHHVSYSEQLTGNRIARLSFTNTGAAVTMFTDAWQFERKAYPTTYLDGDMLGFADSHPYSSYYWHGVPHGSASTRRATTGSGGRIEAWSAQAGFQTTSIVGLMMAPVEQHVQTLGNRRRVHLGMDSLARDFTITGKLFGKSYEFLMDKWIALQRLLRSTNTRGNDQMVLRYQATDHAQQSVGDPLDIVCVYKSGLQGEINSLYQGNVAIQFTAVQPYPVEIFESSIELLLVKELEPNEIVYRDVEGEFFNLGGGPTLGGVVTQVGFLSDGRMAAFGNFTDLAGSAASYGAIWDGVTWVEIPATDTGINDVDDGFHLGYPLTVGTQGGTVQVYDPLANSWSNLGGGDWLGPIFSLARDANGDVWIGGRFDTSQTGFTTYNNVAHWDAALAEWQTIGEGLTDPGDLHANPLQVNSVLVPNDGYVYFAGTFSAGVSGAVNTLGQNHVIRWSIEDEVYLGMGTGLNAAPNEMIIGQDGFIYAVGPFTQNGTETYDLRGFARWNGYAWEEMFPLVKPGGEYGSDGIFQDEEGVFWFYNIVTDPENDLFVVQGLGEVAFFGWRNGIFYPPYLADATIRHMALGPGNQVIHATFPFGLGDPTTKAPAMTRVDYTGSADVPVVVHLMGPGQFNQVRNYSTEGGIYGRTNFHLSQFETVFMRGDTQRTLLYSNQRRNLYARLLGGATNMAAMRLIPGENRISLLMLNGVAQQSDGWLTWRTRYQGIGERVL